MTGVSERGQQRREFICEGYKRPESVLVVVYTPDAKVLLLQRKDSPDFWQSVTGSMQESESEPIISARRELKEETGLGPDQGTMQDCHQQEWFDIYPQWQYRYAPGVTRNLEHVFCFKLKSLVEIKLSQEHLDYCWVTKEQAIAKVISTTNRDAIIKFVI